MRPLRNEASVYRRLSGTRTAKDQEGLVVASTLICRMVLEALAKQLIRVGVNCAEVCDAVQVHQGARFLCHHDHVPMSIVPQACRDGQPRSGHRG